MSCVKNSNPFTLLTTSIGLLLLLINVGYTVPRDNNRQKIILEHADTLRSRDECRFLIGNVQVRRGLTLINSDNAKHDPKNGQITLTGNVVLNEPGRVMKSAYVRFNEFDGSFEARDNVDLVESDSVRIRCNIAQYDDVNQIIDLYGKVIIDNYSDGARITGKHCRWFETTNSGIIDQDPVYKLPDDKGKPDTLTIKSKILQFNRINNSALFTGNVDLIQNKLHALADTLNHKPDSSMTVLSGNPIIIQEKDELSGKRVELYYEGQKLIRMFVDGDALVISVPEEDSTLFNYMIGKEMNMTVINDSTRLIMMKGDAQGAVHVWDGEGLYHGVNQSAADVIELTLVSDKTESIMLKGRSNGVFYPPKDIPDDIGEDNAILLQYKSRNSR